MKEPHGKSAGHKYYFIILPSIDPHSWIRRKQHSVYDIEVDWMGWWWGVVSSVTRCSIKSVEYQHHGFIMTSNNGEYQFSTQWKILGISNISKYCGECEKSLLTRLFIVPYNANGFITTFNEHHWSRVADFTFYLPQKLLRKWMLNGKPLQFTLILYVDGFYMAWTFRRLINWNLSLRGKWNQRL